MEERKIIEDGNLFVTTKRVLVGAKVFPIGQIANAVPFFDDNWKGAAIFIVGGLIAFSFGGTGAVIGLLAIAAGVLFWIYVRDDKLMIVFEGGGHDTISFGRDREKIRRVASAIIQAIQINSSEDHQALREDMGRLKSLRD